MRASKNWLDTAAARAGAIVAAILLGFLACTWPAHAQSKSPIPEAPGQIAFEKTCTTCHANPSTASRAPNLKTLMQLTPEAVYAALTTGSMAVPAKNLTDADKRAIAEYLGGRPLDLSNSGSAQSMPNRCPNNQPIESLSASPAWNGWGAGLGNTRFVTASTAGINADQVPQLKLKWAFGFPNGSTTYGQPSIVAGRLFIGSDNAYVYSLDAANGCVYWSYLAKTGVRTSPSVGPVSGRGVTKFGVFFADLRGNVYALDASTGKLLWTKNVVDHDAARITGAPALYAGRLYVPVSAMEEGFSAAPSYPCCTFRGSVVALDASSGHQIWKSYTIPEAPRPVRKNSQGVQQWAPAGAAVWNAPTIDPERHVLYVGTGDAYTEPAAKTSDAVLALDLRTGRIVWSFQAVKNDAWMVGCVPESTDNCPKDLGVDYDFGSSPILVATRDRNSILLATPKSGTVFALNPNENGEVIWKVDLADKPAPNNGEIAFGGAADSESIYLGLEDGNFAAVDLSIGKRLWTTRLESLDDLGQPTINGENRTKAGLRFGQSAAVTAIRGAAFTGGWDGILRALSTADGRVLWQFNTEQNFKTVNGVAAKGGSMGGPGPIVVNGMLYVGSGYANVGGGLPGNVLLAFAPE